MVNTDALTALKFPIGPFNAPHEISNSELAELVTIIESAPEKYRDITRSLSSADLSKTYREGSWTIHQIVNHVADMQLLHYFRMKKALTEVDYKELTLVNIDGWAFTPDSSRFPVDEALDMFESITNRFVFLIRALNEEQLDIRYFHPLRKIDLTQKQAIAMSAWHVRHHLEHIKIALGT
jgi:hypothetical protein